MPSLLAINNYNYRRGGGDTVFLEHNLLFEAAGWSVASFCMQHDNNLPSEWSSYFVEEIEFGKSYSLPRKLIHGANVLYSFEARRKLDRLVAAVKPDVAHIHNIYHHISPSILGLLRERSVPVVMTLHDLKIACPAYKMLTHDGICERCKGGAIHNVVRHRCVKDSFALSTLVFVEAALHRLIGSYARNVDRFIVPSRFYRDKLVEWGWPAERFCHVPNFVDASRFEPQYEPGDAFVYFGRLGPEKGLPTLVRAAACAHVALRIVGSGPEEDRLRSLASELGANVEFVGYLSGESLHREVRQARAVVLPSEWYENAPVSLMEAYALGKPVIGARIGGIPELVEGERTGAIFESGSVRDLTDALTRFQSMNPAEIAEMGRYARVWVEDHFTSEAYVERMRSVYADLPGRQRPAASGLDTPRTQ